jgi:2-hydroxychromene-2-carboxylate isomerase
MADMSETAAPSVEFFFDPGCPWTWNTSRWLTEVADARGFDIQWRALSLALLNADSEIPEQYREMMGYTLAALRVTEALRAAGRNADAGRWYTELGRRSFHDKQSWSQALLSEAADAAGVADVLGAASDTSWDQAVASSLAEAMDRAGPDVGSPVLVVNGNGAFGPIVSPPPTGDDAVALWDALAGAVAVPGFFELKRGRSGPPEVGARP